MKNNDHQELQSKCLDGITPLFTHQRELMGDSPIWGQLSTKPQSREHLITVVVLDDLSDGFQGHGIGVHLVRVHVVQGSGLGWISFQGRRNESESKANQREGDQTDSCNSRDMSS